MPLKDQIIHKQTTYNDAMIVNPDSSNVVQQKMRSSMLNWPSCLYSTLYHCTVHYINVLMYVDVHLQPGS